MCLSLQFIDLFSEQSQRRLITDFNGLSFADLILQNFVGINLVSVIELQVVGLFCLLLVDHPKGLCAEELTVLLLSYCDACLMDLRIDLGYGVSDVLFLYGSYLFEKLPRFVKVKDEILFLSLRVSYLGLERGKIDLVALLTDAR